MSRVLVTGATGQLGTHLVHDLNEQGIVPRALVRNDYPDEAWGPYRAERVSGDLAPEHDSDDEDHVRRLAETMRGIDRVYHLAAYVHVGVKHADRHARVNVRGTQNLYRAAALAGVRRIVHVSSIVTIGASATGAPLDETAEYNLSPFENPYFETKREAEEWILAQGRVRERERGGPEVVVVCPSINVGERKAVRSRAAQIRDGRKPALLSVTSLPAAIGWLRAFPFRLPIRVNLADASVTARGIHAAGERGRAGERYILGGENLDHAGIVSVLREFVPVARPLIPVSPALFTATAFANEALHRPFGKRPKWDRRRARLARYTWQYDSSKAARELGWEHPPMRETVARILGPLC